MGTTGGLKRRAQWALYRLDSIGMVMVILFVAFMILAFPFLTGQADERAQKMPMMEVIELHEWERCRCSSHGFERVRGCGWFPDFASENARIRIQ